MALSGTINNTFRTGYAVRIAWSISTQDIPNNSSNVTVSVQLVSLGASYTINSSAQKSGTLTINGVQYSFNFSASLSGNQVKTIFTQNASIKHDANGDKTCAFSCSAGIAVTLGSTYYSAVTASGSGVFNSIPRASSISAITSSVTVNGTNTVSVTISRASSSFTHTVVFSLGSYSYTATNIGTSTSYAIPMTWLNAITSGTTATAKATVTTYNGSTKIGTAVSKDFTCVVPSTVVPSITSISISEAVSGIAAQFAAYVQKKSRVAVSVDSAGAYGSTISSTKITVDGSSFSGSSITSGILSTAGSISISVTVTDSRGRIKTETRQITVVAYETPTISAFNVTRSNSSGTEINDGTYLKAVVKFAISSVNNKNTKSYRIEYKRTNATTWNLMQQGSVYSMNQTVVSASGIVSADYAYNVRLVISDFFGTATIEGKIATAFTLVDFNASGKGLAFGKVSEKDAMEVSLDMYDKNGLLIEGKNDSGWVNLSLNSGWTYQYSADIPQYRKINGIVYLRGLVDGTAAAGTIIATLPAGFRPYGSFNRFACVLNQNQQVNIQVNSTGAINDYTKGTASRTFICLAGVSFPI